MKKRSALSSLPLLAAAFMSLAPAVRAASTYAPGAQPPAAQTAAQERPTFQTDSYRVVVESVNRKANNYTVTLVFESLSDKVIKLQWGNSNELKTNAPYLVDERSNKYFLQNADSGNVVSCFGCGSAELLPRTKLKTQLLFFGEGDGKTFTFMTTELSPGYRRSVAIKGLRVTSNEALTDAGASSGLPSLVTESYRVVVSDVQRDADNIRVTLIFENLLDRSFNIAWGEGRYGDGNIWQGAEPYLIDENADRYYLRDRDDGHIVDCFWCDSAELLPGTRLKTHLVFKAAGSGTTFTLACKERSPKSERPVVIQGLRVKSEAAPTAQPLPTSTAENLGGGKASAPEPTEELKEGSHPDVKPRYRPATEAQEAYSQRQYDRAISLANELLSADPMHAQALIVLAQSYFMKDDFDSFLEFANRAINAGGSVELTLRHHHSSAGLASNSSMHPIKLTLTRDNISIDPQLTNGLICILNHPGTDAWQDLRAIEVTGNQKNEVYLRLTFANPANPKKTETFKFADMESHFVRGTKTKSAGGIIGLSYGTDIMVSRPQALKAITAIAELLNRVKAQAVSTPATTN
jgi:hypothetical protein